MRVDFPGLLVERHRNGTPRIRVRVEGDTTRRIHIPVTPDHPDFAHHYHAARAGETWTPKTAPAVAQSLDWLARSYLDFMDKMVQAGQMSAATLKQRRSILTRLCDYVGQDGDRYGDCHMDAPAAAFVEIRDAWAAHPGAADNLTKTIRSLYRWAMERGQMTHNPAAGIGIINRNPKGGATPWTAADLKAFKAAHPPGTMAHLWLTLHAFTACRIGDAIWLGRGQEFTAYGTTYLSWQPRKRGSAEVTIPMLPPLYAATRSMALIGPTYLLSDKGRPFASVEALRVRVQRWCTAAGLTERSSHGIRKAMGAWMAEAGCTQHQIMAVMAHTQAKTSEIYTRSANRQSLAEDAIHALSGMAW